MNFNYQTKSQPLVSISNLSVSFSDGAIPLRDIYLHLIAGETLVLLGESGAGKSLLCKTLFKLYQTPAEMHISGTILGNPKAAMIFQDPSQFLHPRVSIKRHLLEFLRCTEPGITWPKAQRSMVDLMSQVELPATREFFSRKTGELSGGQQQRVMIALALSQNPQLLIADEPVTALDTRTKMVILELLKKIQQELGLTILMVTHDLSAARQIAHRIVVLYAGRILEISEAKDFFIQPQHPYSRALIDAHPGPEHRNKPLFEIPGTMPLPHEQLTGCIFKDRCKFIRPICEHNRPSLLPLDQDHGIACHMVTQKDQWELGSDGSKG